MKKILSLACTSLAFFHTNTPFWFPLVPMSTIMKTSKRPKKAIFFSNPLVIYKNDSDYIVHSDVCPHQGASLSKGWITSEGHLQCPYHGFEFDKGCFCKIPNPIDKNVKKFKSKTKLKTFDQRAEKDFLYLTNGNQSAIDVFFPPEEYDKSFRGISGFSVIPINYKSVCENLLDMLHISYVHSFGSTESPLPNSIKFQQLNDYHGRTTFSYVPNKNTISGIVGKVKKVFVENEYILPTNTITRVFAGETIKTVFTRSVPISENETLLYWKIYRNFWIHPFFDFLISKLMKQTVKEDINILKTLYPESRCGSIRTKYDVTIDNFRKAVQHYEM